MSKIFLVNVGANTSDSSRARSPVFENGRFVYVPFSYPCKANNGEKDYPPAARPFVRNMHGRTTHCDPDWDNYTYGDYCLNRRARALTRAKLSDILVFWGLLWQNTGKTWDAFTGERGWYLFGVFRIEEILTERQKPSDCRIRGNAKRAMRNVHFDRGILDSGNRVFVGSRRDSVRFEKAVPFYTEHSRLLFESVRAADGRPLRVNTRPRWISSTRPCRAAWDLNRPTHRVRVKILSEAIRDYAEFDLLRGIH